MRLLIILLMLMIPTGLHAKLPIGMNIQTINYYGEPVFTDLMKSSSEWLWYGDDWGDEDTGYSLDSNGYPTHLPQDKGDGYKTVRALPDYTSTGSYVLLYDGTGTVGVGGGFSQTGTDTGKIYFTASGGNSWVTITASTLGDNIRNIRIIPIDYENNEANMPIFKPEFLLGLQPFSAVRTMNWQWANNGTAVEWSDRVKKTHYSQATTGGVAIEYAVELANELGQDIWYCVPPEASDEYIINLATMLKNNLNPELKVYLEYSNELWNSMFRQSNWLRNNAIGHTNSYVTDDLRVMNDSLTSDIAEKWASCEPVDNYDWPDGCGFVEYKMAYMSARTFRLFASVYGDDLASRVVRVQGAWLRSTDWSNKSLNYLVNTDGIGVDVLAPSGYFYLNSYDDLDNMTEGTVTAQDVIDNAWLHQEADKSYTTAQADLAKSYGVGYAVYEAGQHMDSIDDNAHWNQALYDAQIHSGMYDLYASNLQNHEDNNTVLWVAFNYVGVRESIHGSWGHLESYDQLDLTPTEMKLQAPKYQALLDFNGTVTPPTTPTSLFQFGGGTYILKLGE